MTTTPHLGLTGTGFEPTPETGSTVIWRFHVSGVGIGGALFPFGDPQRYGGIGWVSPYDFVPSGFDGVMPADFNFIREPIRWIDVLDFELDETQYSADIFGISGMAYALNPGVTVDLYVVTF